MTYMKNADRTEGKNVYKIVITGGPCGGKTTAISRIHDEFTSKGYNVITVSETATDLIMGGIAPWTTKSSDTFQKILMELQLKKEETFFKAAESLKNPGKVLIILDRGVLDGKAYMTSDDAFDTALFSKGLSVSSALERYDAVFHLTTAAKGAESFYTLTNNSARTETPEEAILLDSRVKQIWENHPCHFVIENNCGFEEKINRLLAEISEFIGHPVPYEIERKFLIEYPDVSYLEDVLHCRKSEIVQTYLKSPDDAEIRVRMRSENGQCFYTKTVKKKISGIKRIELEERISKEEYIVELLDADPQKSPVAKTRYCLEHDGRTFEIDVYPFWKDKAVMEVELSDENDVLSFPHTIKVIKEVTDDKSYKNANLAKLCLGNGNEE